MYVVLLQGDMSLGISIGGESNQIKDEQEMIIAYTSTVLSAELRG